MLVYLNGDYLPLEEAQVPVLDRGFLFGDGVYEVIPAYGGHPFRLEEHLQRLENSLRAIRMEPPLTRRQWGEIFHRLLDPLGDADQQLYLQVTRGAYERRLHAIPKTVTPTVFVMSNPLAPRDPELVARGLAAVTLEDIRWQRCDIKAITLLANILAQQQARDAGADEAILVRDGLATEGTASNFFLVKEGRILTPPKSAHLLPGITRDLVLELAQEAELPWEERDIPVEELKEADEIWVTSSTKEVMPVTRLDGRLVGNGVPGPMWQKMDTLYSACKARLRAGPTNQCHE